MDFSEFYALVQIVLGPRAKRALVAALWRKGLTPSEVIAELM